MEYNSITKTSQPVMADPVMKQIYKKAALLADKPVDVLIYGESGVGKSYLADYIQKHRSKSPSPFIQIHCNAISSELFASELFGYSPNAFTGASPKGKIGLLEAANHGTVLFDEINELSLANQTLLLHFLQNKTLTPIGSVKSKTIDARIICTSGRNLLEMIQEGTFRSDLYYRICVANIYIPPIRQRKAEIPVFFDYFINRFAADFNCSKKQLTLTDSQIKALCQLEWKGNIRQIENLAQYICLTDDVDQIIDTYKRLNQNSPQTSHSDPSPEPSGPEPADAASLLISGYPIKPLKEAVELFERAYIQRVIKETSTLQEAADILNISFSTLCRKKREP